MACTSLWGIYLIVSHILHWATYQPVITNKKKSTNEKNKQTNKQTKSSETLAVYRVFIFIIARNTRGWVVGGWVSGWGCRERGRRWADAAASAAAPTPPTDRPAADAALFSPTLQVAARGVATPPVARRPAPRPHQFGSFFFTQKKNFRSFLLLSLVSVSTHLRFFDLSWGLASRFFCCWCCCCF